MRVGTRGTGKLDLTMESNLELDRRKVLGTVGGLAIAGSGLAAFTGSATASVNTRFKAHGTNVLKNDDGSVREVLVDVDGDYSWDNLDSPATMATVSLKAKVPEKTAKKTAHSETWKVNGTHGSGSFSFEGVDLTETFSDAVFEDDTDDGQKKVTDVKLWIVVSISYGDGQSVGNSANDTMGVHVNNLASQANVNGESDASASSYDQRYLSPDNPEADGPAGNQPELSTKGVLDLYIYYGDDRVTYQLHVEEPWSDDSEEHANVGMGFDTEADGTADWQIIWQSGDGFSFKRASGGGWTDESMPDRISTSKDGTVITVSFPKSWLTSGGNEYKFVINSSYGGHTHANISADGTNSWQGPNGSWTSSYYYVSETAL